MRQGGESIDWGEGDSYGDRFVDRMFNPPSRRPAPEAVNKAVVIAFKMETGLPFSPNAVEAFADELFDVPTADQRHKLDDYLEGDKLERVLERIAKARGVFIDIEAAGEKLAFTDVELAPGEQLCHVIVERDT